MGRVVGCVSVSQGKIEDAYRVSENWGIPEEGPTRAPSFFSKDLLLLWVGFFLVVI